MVTHHAYRRMCIWTGRMVMMGIRGMMGMMGMICLGEYVAGQCNSEKQGTKDSG